MGQRKGKRQLGTSRHGWEDNINMDFFKEHKELDESGSGLEGQ